MENEPNQYGSDTQWVALWTRLHVYIHGCIVCAVLSILGEYYRINGMGESVEVEVFRNTVIGSEQDWNNADGKESDIGCWISEYREIASRLLNG